MIPHCPVVPFSPLTARVMGAFGRESRGRESRDLGLQPVAQSIVERAGPPPRSFSVRLRAMLRIGADGMLIFPTDPLPALRRPILYSPIEIAERAAPSQYLSQTVVDHLAQRLPFGSVCG